jgi:hypothetical protein
MKLGRTVHRPERPAPWMELIQAESRRARRQYKDGVTKDLLGSASFVSMVQAAYLRNGNDTTVLRSVYGSRLRGVFRQG